MTEPDTDLLSINQVADVLGVSASRVRQLAADRQLPEPVDLGARVGAWYWTDIAAIKLRRQGQPTSPVAGLLPSATEPLPRIRDRVLEVDLGPRRGRKPMHLRVWQGDAAEGRRTVAVLGTLADGVDVADALHECLRAAASDLDLPDTSITWFLYRPYEQHRIHYQQVHHVITGAESVDRDDSHERRRWRRTPPGASQDPAPRQWRRKATLGEIERLLNADVEAYPGPAYRPAVIEEWQRRRRTLDVPHDTVDFGRLMRAINYLHWTRQDLNDASRLDDLDAAIWLLADDAQVRLDQAKGHSFNDGTHPPQLPDARLAHWPDAWAARLVPPRPDDAELEILRQYPTEFVIPQDPADHRDRRDLLARLRTWIEDVDAFSDRHDPALTEALTVAADLLAFYLGVFDPTFRANDHPDSVPRTLHVHGTHDRAYLDSVSWQDTPPANTRAYRVLDGQLGSTQREGLRYGYDTRGALVIHNPGDPRTPRSEWYLTEWPLRPPRSGIPAGTDIVADGPVDGDRAAYITGPGIGITPLPLDPGHRVDQWSFGYSGGGPSALAHAIESAIMRADGIGDDVRPSRAWRTWLGNQVSYGLDEPPRRHREMSELRLPVDQIRQRYRLEHSQHR
ncbi:hypothetical protein ED92_10845 [Amycolatopsis sp. MJM2582]|uniref:helix-turn-helix transcriptional regulator n=1 Tax=Amycolatopsis sp. MJM2582 TaxID=1427749 RepID=UPI0005071A3D|nr:hypothetical protein [Amycolatopsis sp. MJM2582]KFZ80822.1 hypothetical protein ED92_10845 [Amycolatopsis sp. MJM2582]